MKPSVITRCVANSYSGPDERIIEFSDRKLGLGGLISFRRTHDGKLRVEVYRVDDGVEVVAPQPKE